MTVDDVFAAELLARLRSVAGTSVTHEPDGDPDIFPALELYEGGARPIEHEAGSIRWEAIYTVTGIVETDDAAAAPAARNALRSDAVAAIMADEQLGGLVEDIELGDVRRITAVLAERRRLAFEQDFVVQFSTSRTDPGQPA